MQIQQECVLLSNQQCVALMDFDGQQEGVSVMYMYM